MRTICGAILAVVIIECRSREELPSARSSLLFLPPGLLSPAAALLMSLEFLDCLVF